MSVLNYHLERDNRYSIAYIADNKQDVVQRTTEYENRVVVEQETVGNDTYYMIYGRSETEPPLKNLTEDGIIEWLNKNFSSGEQQTLVTIVLEFNNKIDEVEEEGRTFALYKQSDFEKIPAILESVSWEQDVSSVAGELLSQFILHHPMPNANHRTGISFMSRYLSTIDNSFEMIDTGEEGSWYSWARSYIHDSKRLGTLRRKRGLFKYARKQGYDTVRRKEGIEIDLRERDLDRNDFHDYYEEQHTDRSIEFVRTVLDETGYEDLKEESDDGKAAFLQRLSGD